MRTTRTLFAIGALSATLFALPPFFASPQVQLGKVKVPGQTKKTFSAPSTPSDDPVTFTVYATLINDSRTDYEDLTINVKKDPEAPEDDPIPTGGDSEVQRPNNGGKSSSPGSPTSKGTTAHMNFQGGSNSVGTWKDPEVLYAKVELTAQPGQDLQIEFNPSKTGVVPIDVDAHADFVGTFELSSTGSSQTVGVLNGYNQYAVATLRNIDRAARAVTGISGAIADAEDTTLGIDQIHLVYAGTPTEVPGANFVITGNQFTITGFPQLQPSSAYDVVVDLNHHRAGDYRLQLSATFAP